MVRDAVEWLGERYSVMVMVLVLGAGLVSYYVDRRQMQTRGLSKESEWARWIGLSYMIGGVLLWLTLQVLMRILGLR